MPLSGCNAQWGRQPVPAYQLRDTAAWLWWAHATDSGQQNTGMDVCPRPFPDSIQHTTLAVCLVTCHGRAFICSDSHVTDCSPAHTVGEAGCRPAPADRRWVAPICSPRSYVVAVASDSPTSRPAAATRVPGRGSSLPSRHSGAAAAGSSTDRWRVTLDTAACRAASTCTQSGRHIIRQP
jgi:hypothetical protein